MSAVPGGELELWFGDERGYNATRGVLQSQRIVLWFGDERGYNATHPFTFNSARRCGLVMKEDITQPASRGSLHSRCCGLVMKEDITQQSWPTPTKMNSCGLVMKEDITQLHEIVVGGLKVVVW